MSFDLIIELIIKSSKWPKERPLVKLHPQLQLLQWQIFKGGVPIIK
tara:strand:- start:914 stop:1051 length:138 start_codon:yes stop_codon:yes gene_type:complete